MPDPALHDMIVIGAGPAGMAAATTAAQQGASVLVLDEQPRPGGQIYRGITRTGLERDHLGPAYAAGLPLAQALNQPNITCQFGATVWRLERAGQVLYSAAGQSHVATAPHVVLASGAQERPCPFPGWTLPGVMTCGAAQILMKASGQVPRDAVLAGSGPLLYLVAVQLIRAGVPPRALVETRAVSAVQAALPYLPAALLGWKLLLKGAGMLHQIRKAGVPRYTGAHEFRAAAGTSGSRLQFSFESQGRSREIDCGLLLVHQGVVPATHLTRSAGIHHIWNDHQRAWQPKADVWGNTDVPSLIVAGDGAGIGGAEAALHRGSLAALGALFSSRRIDRATLDRLAGPHRKALTKALAPRRFLDVFYAPPQEFLSPSDDTIVCRCEEVTAADIRAGAGEGAGGLRKIKVACRAGMGPCQGRMCDLTVSEVLAEATGHSVLDLGPQRARTPVKPVTLGELAVFSERN